MTQWTRGKVFFLNASAWEKKNMQDFFVLLQPTHSVRMTSPEVSQDALVRRSGLGLGSEGLCTTPTVDVPKVEVQTRCVRDGSAGKQTRSQDVSNNQYNGRD